MVASSRTLITALATAIVALGPLTMSIYGPSMPAIAVALDTTGGMVQLTLTVYLIGFALAQLVYGPLSDRFGRRRLLILGLVVYVLGSAACALAGSIEMLIAARLVQAAGACAGPALGRAMVRDVFARHEAARVLAVVGMALALAPAVGPVLGGHLQSWFDWEAIFVLLGAAGLVLLLAVARSLPETNRHPDPDALRPARIARNYLGLLRHPVFLGYLGPAAVTLGGLFTFMAVAPFLLIDGAGLSPRQYGWTSLPIVGAYLLGSALVTRCSGRAGLDRLILASGALVLTGAGLLLVLALAGAPGVASLIGPILLWGGGMGLALPTATAGALAPFPHMAGTASALMGCMQMGTGALGSLLVSRLHEGSAVPVAVTLATLGLGGYALYYALVWRRHDRVAAWDPANPAAGRGTRPATVRSGSHP